MLDTLCQRLIAEARIPGIAAAVIRDTRLDCYVCHGVRGVQSPDPVDADTVFDAASLSKPVFAHAVLQLADQGRLSLDVPLLDYLPNYLRKDETAVLVTARHVLSHCAGLPNWRSARSAAQAAFPPWRAFQLLRRRFSVSAAGGRGDHPGKPRHGGRAIGAAAICDGAVELRLATAFRAEPGLSA
jgi:CubicO group peptidase (beta-lactamase class C family)